MYFRCGLSVLKLDRKIGLDIVLVNRDLLLTWGARRTALALKRTRNQPAGCSKQRSGVSRVQDHRVWNAETHGERAVLHLSRS
jgi:hypothetical protein